HRTRNASKRSKLHSTSACGAFQRSKLRSTGPLFPMRNLPVPATGCDSSPDEATCALQGSSNGSGSMDWVDLRSDTVTRPTAAMRAAMLAADVGDDVYGEDPTVNALQQRLAGELGFDAGLFVPSGTQSNLLALLAHCERGDEYLVGMDAHTYKFEGGGAAVLGSIQPQPIVQADDGSLPLERIEAAIKPVDPHFARTRVLALENTWHGR